MHLKCEASLRDISLNFAYNDFESVSTVSKQDDLSITIFQLTCPILNDSIRRSDRIGIGRFAKYFYSQKLETKYSEDEKKKILNVINSPDEGGLSNYDITKTRLKNFNKWKSNNGSIKCLSDIESVSGFTEKTAVKLFNSILRDEQGDSISYKLKLNQILSPQLSDNLIKSSKSVLAVYTTVNSVCWSLIDKEDYTLTDWQYYPTEDEDRKRINITDILATAWEVVSRLPQADLYVMKSEATTLRAAGSDPNNPRIMAVNLQKAQLVAMIIALLNYRNHNISLQQMEDGMQEKLVQKVYFLRSTLPFRLFGTLIGNEQVSTDQTIEMLLPTYSRKCANNSHVFIPGDLIKEYKNKLELEKDMLATRKQFRKVVVVKPDPKV